MPISGEAMRTVTKVNLLWRLRCEDEEESVETFWCALLRLIGSRLTREQSLREDITRVVALASALSRVGFTSSIMKN